MSCEAVSSGTLSLLRPPWIDRWLVLSLDVQFWTNIYSVDITSNECLSKVRTLLSCPSKIAVARSFQGNEAQIFIDFLDRVLTQSCPDTKLRQRSLLLLSKICKARTIIPSSYVLQKEFISVGRVHYRGGFSDVSNGEYLGCPVAIKCLKVNEEDFDRVFKRLCREIIGWKHLSHPNILPLLGVSVLTDPHCFRILTEWMPNGNVMRYARSNPEANRLRLLSETASGVAYLHDLGVVHGDLKGANILVDNTGNAHVADFGLMTTIDLSTSILSETVISSGGTVCWMSPELLDPPCFDSDGLPTRESDCYALGMVIYEVLTGLRPFHHLRAFSPVPAVLRGERPEEPLEAESLGFSFALWELVQLCWSESSSTRPTARQLFDCLSSASLTWVPPRVYPVTKIASRHHTRERCPSGSDSSGFVGVFLASSECEV
ncbi:kinase-like protein [Thelephora ganbajun]|uniref:Kinase-like protein n=1 Tax=Thelephora ganbajun TaxID=370292 RepID=A0ACB6ZEV8_THEGA|nr:kinase-like protein [Thelephora ganbajun]